jgi:hypothetical protein
MQELLDHPAGFFAKASISSRNWQAEHCMGIFGLCQRWPKQRQRNDIARLGIQTILDTHTRDITCGETPDLQQILCWLWKETSLAPSNDEGVWLNACAYVYNIYIYTERENHFGKLAHVRGQIFVYGCVWKMGSFHYVFCSRENYDNRMVLEVH